MNKVFVTQENPSIDYSDAERFGDVVFLSFREYSGLKNSISDKEIRAEIKSKLSNYNPLTDYLLFTGSPVLIGYAFHVAMNNAGSVNVLRWRSRSERYEVINFGEEE